MSKPENWYVVRYDDQPAVLALRSERETKNLPLRREVAERVAAALTTASAAYWATPTPPVDGIVKPRGYYFHDARELLSVDSTTDQAIPVNNPLTIPLLAPTEIPGRIAPGEDFVVEWEGAIAGRIDTAGTLHVTLVTTHVIVGRNFAHRRSHALDIQPNTTFSVALNGFNSRSVVRIGDNYDGEMFDAAAFAGPTTIAYDIEITLTERRNLTRKTGNLTELHGENLSTTAYQI